MNPLNAHIAKGREIQATVWYSGTDALFKGEGVCYNTDYGTATTADASRANRVERPTSTSRVFAGVAARSYSAKSTGQFIEIFEPGSKGVPVALGVDTVIDTGLLTFAVKGRYNIGVSTGLGTEAGRFQSGKYRGRGSAIPRQTVTALIEASMTGGWSIAADGLTLTVASTTGLAAGDTVVLLGGEDDGTGAVIPGKYTIASVTDGTDLVLTAPSSGATAVDATTTALACTGYAYTGNPTALCDLLDGEESGGVEYISAPNAGTAAQPHMVGGVSYVCGGATHAADVEVEFALGVLPGDKKAFIVLGTMTTKDFVVDIKTTNGLRLDGSSSLAEINNMDAAGDECYLEFHGTIWHTMAITGNTAEA